MQEYKLYINVILENIRKIENSISKISKNKFMRDLDLQDATLMRLQVIGENIKKIPNKIKNQHKELNWKKFQKLRNIISHKYSSIDYNIIWSFLDNNLNELKEVIKKIK